MKIDMNKEVTLYNPKFKPMLDELDLYIRRVFNVMDQKDTDSSNISLTIDINMLHENVSDPTAYLGYRDAVIPNVEYKLGFKTESKEEHKEQITDNGEELMKTPSGKYLIVTREEASGQTSMFEEDVDDEEE